MPRGDGTGPQGLGPQTGRGAWLCTDPELGDGPSQRVEQGSARFGRGSGWRCFRGRGICRRMTSGPGAVPAVQQETPAALAGAEALQISVRQLEEELTALTKLLSQVSNT